MPRITLSVTEEDRARLERLAQLVPLARGTLSGALSVAVVNTLAAIERGQTINAFVPSERREDGPESR